MKYYNSKARQAGMTLIELTVVLLVLIGLAGLLMPYVEGFVTKTHDSTGSSNLAEVNNAMLKYQAAFQQFPDDLDSLIDDQGTPAVYQKLMGPNCLAVHDLSNNPKQAMALTMAGIDKVMIMKSATTDATFDATSSSTPIINKNTTPTTYAKVARLTNLMDCNTANPTMAINDTNLKNVITLKPDTAAFDYFVFGVGQDSSMIGKTITTAPVHFAQSGNMGPKLKYNRFAVVFAVPKETILVNGGYCTGAETTAGTVDNPQPATEAACTANTLAVAGTWTKVAYSNKAQYAGAVMLMPMIEGLTGALQRHYDKAAQG